MGHERIGLLPKSKQWGAIVRDLSTAELSGTFLAELASKTLSNVRDRFNRLSIDQGVRSAFEFLVYLSVSSRENAPDDKLRQLGIAIPESPSAIQLAKAVHEWVEQHDGAREYSRMAARAAADAIVTWQVSHQTSQLTLFELSARPLESWRATGTASGFCELSRLFFAKLTERYLNYFLEREASAAIATIEGRETFREQMSHYVDSVSNHAFEMSKITQSFAAGWFNKNAQAGLPTDSAVNGFLSHAFQKMREELLIEDSAT